MQAGRRPGAMRENSSRSRAHLFFRTSFWEVEFSYFVTRLLNFMMMLFGGIFPCEWFIKWAAARIFTFLFLHYNDTMINHNHVISCSRFLFIPRRRRRRVLNCRAAASRDFSSLSLLKYYNIQMRRARTHLFLSSIWNFSSLRAQIPFAGFPPETPLFLFGVCARVMYKSCKAR